MPKKLPSKNKKEVTAATPRVIKTPPKVSGSFRLFIAAVRVVARNWKIFAGILAVYALLTIIFVQGFNSGGLSDIKSALEDASADRFVSALTLFMYLSGSASRSVSDAGTAYQLFLALIMSLATIWTLREVYADRKIRIRAAFYRGMYPFVPFVLVLGVILLQLIPLVLGAFVYSLVGSGTGMSGIGLILWTVVFALTALLSLYLVCSSLFALYIVCLPDMTPLAALRSAKKLVQGKRWMIMRKILFLPIALFVCATAVTLPLIFIWTPLAGVVYFVLSLASLIIVHSYMYRLYRELL
jgi:hypothetical protein